MHFSQNILAVKAAAVPWLCMFQKKLNAQTANIGKFSIFKVKQKCITKILRNSGLQHYSKIFTYISTIFNESE